MRFLRRWFIRLTGPCPVWHHTTERIKRITDNRIVFECALCTRDTSQVPAGTNINTRPIVPLKARPALRMRRRA